MPEFVQVVNPLSQQLGPAPRMQVPPDPQTGSRRGDQLFDTSSSVHPVPALFALPRVLVGNSPGYLGSRRPLR